MNGYELTQTGGILCADFSRGLNGRHITADHDGDQSGSDLFGTDQYDVRRLDHCIRRLDSSYETPGLDHS